MEKYQFSAEQQSLMEGMKIPFAIYQFVDHRVVTLVLTDGFCELFGYTDRTQAYYDMDHDMYKDTHPDDVSRIADAAVHFATEGGKYEVRYRSRTAGGTDYRIIHAQGIHTYTPEGVRLAQIWYTDEGACTEQALGEMSAAAANRYDFLTGLPGMVYFFELAEAQREAAQRSGKSPLILYLNFSGMKFYNHKYGFVEGNRLLSELARLLSATFGNESCGRIGQDHFAVFTEAEGIEERLTQLFNACEALNSGNSLPLRVGICGKWFDGEPASKACDRAKAACDALRNTVVSNFGYYNAELQEDVKRRRTICENLDRAIAENWIKVYYQPIVRAANGKVCDEEALARWVDPEDGILPPGSFIPYLEDAGLIHKLDLYVLEQVLEKHRQMKLAGFDFIPHSINLSRADFDACDMVEEIRCRVDAAGVDRKLIAIEITESIIGSDFERMKQQIERFQALGFPVWLDDFGSGYSSLDALQSIRFDTVKFDMSFMQKLDESESSRIVLTELMKLATSLNADTVCEGVETEEQIRFLQEIGCGKLQGFYFGRPASAEFLMERFRSGELKLGYENPDEVPYYEAIGKVNLYDLGVIGDEEENAGHFFNTLPMGIIEVRDGLTRFVRSNQSYRDFVKHFLGYDLAREGTAFVPYDNSFVNNIVKTCCEKGVKSFFDERLPNGAVVHSLARRIGVNPVNGTVAVAVAVLSITNEDEGTTYAAIARALASDYYNIYYIDLDTDQYIEYTSPVGGEGLAIERHGDGFFASARNETMVRIFPEDQELFLAAFTKERIIRELDEHGVFTITYRLTDFGAPLYANMKITRLLPGASQIIMGISIIDAQMKQKELLEEARKEKEALARVMALSEEYLIIYTVDPETNRYTEYTASSEFESLGIAKEGADFFRDCIENGKKTVCPEDYERYEQTFTKENVLFEIRTKGAFQLNYSLRINELVKPVIFRIAPLNEGDGEKLIAGLKIRPTESESRAEADRFQSIVDLQVKPCAILSVEKGQDGTPGVIRIVRANRAYKETMGSKYYDNMPYYELVPKVVRFESSCYRCAIEGQQIHNYTQTKVDGLWTDQQLIPLFSDREDLGYCLFIIETSKTVDRERMSAVSIRTAAAVLKAAITLLGTNDLKERVGTVLTDILELSEAFSVRALLIDHENKRAINYCDRWAVPIEEGFAVEEDPDQAVISYPLICSWEKCLGTYNFLAVTTEGEMNELALLNPGWVNTMRAYGVTTLLLIPLRHEREIIGYLYLCNFNPDKVAEVREMAELMSFFIGTEVYNAMLLKRLDAMSHTDALTGLNNRNAMIQRTKMLSQSAEATPFGVVNLDLNGLKTVNDLQGHDAGDQLLVSASEMLKKYFYSGDLYRTGGDEFIVIATGITKEAFDRKVERLRQATRKDGAVSFAIGAYWSDGSEDVPTVFRKADEIMYADKSAYYAAHPEQRR